MIVKRIFAPFCAFLTGFAFLAAAPPAEPQLFRRPSSQTVTIEVLDVGQGDSILIRSPEGKTALIDAGPSRTAALTALKRKGSRRSTWWRSAITIATITAAWTPS